MRARKQIGIVKVDSGDLFMSKPRNNKRLMENRS